MMPRAEETIRQLGIEIPPGPEPLGTYNPTIRTGQLVFSSGALGTIDGKLIVSGRVGMDVSMEQACASARQAVLNALGAIRAEIASLDNVTQVVRLNVFVNSAEDFTDQHKVANAPSDLLVQIFGDCGKGTRCAIGASGLPLNAPVELDLIVEVR